MSQTGVPPDPELGSSSRSLQLLSCNILAGGSMRGYRDYVTQSWKHVLPHGKRENLDGLARVIVAEVLPNGVTVNVVDDRKRAENHNHDHQHGHHGHKH